jgi:glutamate-1-semialdehyde 2,1-aminomutase
MPSEGFLDFHREITRDNGIPLIFDEVISFRVGYGGAQGKYGGSPDLTTFGKIIGGGLPVGAVGGRSEIMSLLDPTQGPPKVASGGTFSANPLTMVAGLVAMEQLTPQIYDRLDRLGRRLRTESNAIFASAGEPAQISGDGSVFRILMIADPIVGYRSTVLGSTPPGRLGALHRNLLDEGVIVHKEGLGCLSTPMNDIEIDGFLTALERSVARLPELD